ncbi:transposase-like protein [Rhodococcus opacus]|nr:transposase-like protein [Rhodococcus opacus]
MEAYVQGISTRNVDDLVAALGVESGISKSQVSRICGGLDTEIARFRDRTLTHTTFPYIFLDATYCKVRIGAHVVSHALVVATSVSIDGTREVQRIVRLLAGVPDRVAGAGGCRGCTW